VGDQHPDIQTPRFHSLIATLGKKQGTHRSTCWRGLYPQPLVPLLLNNSGSATGRVTTEPARIDLGATCPPQSANFAAVSQFTLTA